MLDIILGEYLIKKNFERARMKVTRGRLFFDFRRTDAVNRKLFSIRDYDFLPQIVKP